MTWMLKITREVLPERTVTVRGDAGRALAFLSNVVASAGYVSHEWIGEAPVAP